MSLTECLDSFEKQLIEDALRQTGGHVGSAAKQLLLPAQDPV